MFFVISAWYLLDEKYVFSINSLFKVFIETMIFSTLAVIMAKILGVQHVGIELVIKRILSPMLNTYWFATAYFLFYLMLPFIRKVTNILTDSQLITINVILTIFIPLYRSFLSVAPVSNVDLAIYIAFLVALVKRKRKWFEKRVGTGIIINLIVVFGGYFTSKLLGFANYGYEIFINRYSIFMIWGAIFVFMLFEKVVIFDNKMINVCAKTMYGVFVLHACPEVATLLWSEVFQIQKYYMTKIFVVYLPMCSAIVMVVCMMIVFVVGCLLRLIKVKGRIVDKIDLYINMCE